MTRIREDVWTVTLAEGDWPAVLDAYEKAVRILLDRDPENGKPSRP